MIQTTPKQKTRSVSCEELLNKVELAKRLKVSTRTIDNWRESGVIKTEYKINSQVRFSWSEVLDELKYGKGAAA